MIGNFKFVVAERKIGNDVSKPNTLLITQTISNLSSINFSHTVKMKHSVNKTKSRQIRSIID